MRFRNRFKIETYNIGFIKKSLSDVIDNGLKVNDIFWMKHNYKDRFFADPFMLDEDKEFYYVLCEEYSFIRLKGQISLLTIRKEDYLLRDRKTIIKERWHLSYPFIYRQDNDIYIMPESANSGKLFLYKLDVSNLMIAERKAILSEPVLDATIHTDEFGKRWLFATKSRECEDLFLYSEIVHNAFQFGSPIPLMNDDKKGARSAGSFFYYKNTLYRPAQDCTERYGRRVVLQRIKNFDSKGYDASIVQEISSDNNPPYSDTLHTFNVYNNCIVVDGSADFIYFPMKVIYRLKHKISCFRERKKNKQGVTNGVSVPSDNIV